MSKIMAIPYYIDGLRSLDDAARHFNSLDKSDKIFSTRKGMGSYIKSVIGNDFSMKQLCERNGFMLESQQVKFSDTAKSLRIRIDISEKGCGIKINAVLIILIDNDLLYPERLISLYPLSADKPTYLTVEVGYNKLSKFAKDHLGIDH